MEERSYEAVIKSLSEAKLNEDDVFPKTQCIYFSKDYSNNNNLKLMEVDNDMLNYLSSGDVLQFKGEGEENVVLITKNQTYEVILTETSNSLLLVTDLLFKDQVENDQDKTINKVQVNRISYECLELRLDRPKVKKLHKLLENSVYKGPEFEYEIREEDLHTYEDILQHVQCSESEFKEALNSLLTLEIDGYIRLIEFEYHFRVLSYMLKLIDENSWRLDEINYETTIESLSEIVPDFVINAVFNYYTKESKLLDFVQLYEYKQDEICKFFAKVLLSNAGKFNLNEFLQAWSESVPEGMITDEKVLSDIAIIDRESKPNVIKYYPESDLPEDVNERLKLLFEIKKMWTSAEITPYLGRLADKKSGVNGLLAKYTRGSVVSGVKYYSMK